MSSNGGGSVAIASICSTTHIAAAHPVDPVDAAAASLRDPLGYLSERRVIAKSLIKVWRRCCCPSYIFAKHVGLALWLYSRIGAFHVGRQPCMMMHPNFVWFRHNWYRPVDDDANCYLVNTFAPAFFLLSAPLLEQ